MKEKQISHVFTNIIDTQIWSNTVKKDEVVSHYKGQNNHLLCSKQTKIKTQYLTPVV